MPKSMAIFWASRSFSNDFIAAGIWGIPGFTTQTVRPDWMHCSCLGILQYLQGICLWEIFASLGGTISGKNRFHHLHTMKVMFQVMARELGLEMPFWDITIPMFRSKTSMAPKLKLKAAEGRHFLPILRATLQKCIEMESAHAQLRFQCVDAMDKCYKELDAWDDAASPLRLQRFGRMHLMLYGELNKEAGRARLLWLYYPKHHLFAHCTISQTNPKLLWAYGFESEIGEAVLMTKGCNPAHLHHSVIERKRVLG